jgi:hypothetical protein
VEAFLGRPVGEQGERTSGVLLSWLQAEFSHDCMDYYYGLLYPIIMYCMNYYRVYGLQAPTL